MKTTIKIHDSTWFKKHCKVIHKGVFHESSSHKPIDYAILMPKCWKDELTLNWVTEDHSRSLLEGQVLEVGRDDGIVAGDITDSRYFAGGHWIPNWAIEWVMEEAEA